MKLLDFPDAKQAFEFDCGAKALEAVLAYYGIDVREDIIMKYAGTNPKDGTSIKGLCSVLDRFGLKFDSRCMVLDDLRSYIDQKTPVIVLLQAWNSKDVDYSKDFKDGHWVVLVGYDKDRFIFQDPTSIERAFLTNDELLDRWHSMDDGVKIVNHGVAVFGKRPVYSSGKLVHMD